MSVSTEDLHFDTNIESTITPKMTIAIVNKVPKKKNYEDYPKTPTKNQKKLFTSELQ